MRGLPCLPAAGLCLLVGCAAPPSVVATWGDNIARLGIDPVYPPNAMLSPGQVDVTPQAPDGSSRSDVYARRSIKLGHIDLREALLAESMTAIHLPDTSAAPAASGIWPRASAPNIFAAPTVAAAAGKAPLLVLPGFEVARGTVADFSAVAPLKFLSAAFGGGAGTDTEITVSIPAAEVLGRDRHGRAGRVGALLLPGFRKANRHGCG